MKQLMSSRRGRAGTKQTAPARTQYHDCISHCPSDSACYDSTRACAIVTTKAWGSEARLGGWRQGLILYSRQNKSTKTAGAQEKNVVCCKHQPRLILTRSDNPVNGSVCVQEMRKDCPAAHVTTYHVGNNH